MDYTPTWMKIGATAAGFDWGFKNQLLDKTSMIYEKSVLPDSKYYVIGDPSNKQALGSALMMKNVNRPLFPVNDKGESGIILILKDPWPQVNLELYMKYSLDSDEP